MKEREVKKILSEAKKSRFNGDFPNALALLHQAHNAFPKAVNYCYLLAATYFESREVDPALEYSKKALELDADFKETYELLGDIYTKKEDLETAVVYYLKAYALDKEYTSVEDKLSRIYMFKTKKYEEVIKICDNKKSYLKLDVSTAKTRVAAGGHIDAIGFKGMALIFLGKYKEAIEEIIHLKKMKIKVGLPVVPSINLRQDEQLYKMYFKLDNEPEKIKEYRTLLISEYNITEEKLIKLEEEATNDIILPHQRMM